MNNTNQMYSNRFSDSYVNEVQRSQITREATPPNNSKGHKVVQSIKSTNIVGILERRVLC